MTPKPADRYDTTAITLHWLLALAIVGSFSVGLYIAPATELALSLIHI